MGRAIQCKSSQIFTRKEGISMEAKEAGVMATLDVSKVVTALYIKNYWTITKNNGRFVLFAGDKRQGT